jgi:hypothetical protein
LLQISTIDCSFSHDRALDGASVAVLGISITVNKCNFTSELSDAVGGVTSSIGGGGAIFCVNCDNSSIDQSIFDSCSANGSNGGAIFIQTLGAVSIKNCAFHSMFVLLFGLLLPLFCTPLD